MYTPKYELLELLVQKMTEFNIRFGYIVTTSRILQEMLHDKLELFDEKMTLMIY